MKRIIKLKESDLHRIISESVKRALSEGEAWANQPPIDKFHPDWWYYRQEIEPKGAEDFDPGIDSDGAEIGESKLHKAIREAIKSELGMTDKQKQSRRNTRFRNDVDSHYDDPFEPNYSDRIDMEAPFHEHGWAEDKIASDRRSAHRYNRGKGKNGRRKDRSDESRLNRIIRESIKRVISESEDEFVPHGYYADSNWGGKEVQISDSGDAARFRRNYGTPEDPTDWLEIQYHPEREDFGAYCETPWGDEPLSNYMRR